MKTITIAELSKMTNITARRLLRASVLIEDFPPVIKKSNKGQAEFELSAMRAYLADGELLIKIRRAEYMERNPSAAPISPLRKMALDFLAGKYSPAAA